MNKSIHFTLVIICLTVLTSSLSSYGSTQEKAVHGEIHTKDGQAYKLIHTATSKRPHWITTPPQKQQGRYFVVGLSEYQSSEKLARKEAIMHARKEFVAYTGVHVKDIMEVLKVLYGSAEGVLDTQTSATSLTTQTAEAPVSRIQPQQWYWETYRARGGAAVEDAVFYKYWVLVTVPEDEFDRIQQWKRKQETIVRVAVKDILNRHKNTRVMRILVSPPASRYWRYPSYRASKIGCKIKWNCILREGRLIPPMWMTYRMRSSDYRLI